MAASQLRQWQGFCCREAMYKTSFSVNPVKILNNTDSHARLPALLWAAALLMLMTTLAGCSHEPKLPQLSPQATILAFGDSLTAGKGVSESSAYPAVLQTLSSRKVINAGISGETTSEGLIRLADVLRDENPDLLILFEGGNDILRNQDLTVTKSNLSQMILLAKEQNVSVVLIGVPKKSLLGKTASFYDELAEEHDIPLEASIVGKLLRNPSMKSDSVHFNTAGYATLAEGIFELLNDTGAL